MRDVEEGWGWIGRAAVLLLLTALLGIGLISAGVFDPKPLGEFVTGLPVEKLSVGAGGSRVHWLDRRLPAGPYSLHLTAARQSGENDIGYGLALGDEDGYVVAAVSPLGYVMLGNCQLSIANCQLAMNDSRLLPWQTWPHVRPGVNELWLDVAGDALTVRVNREFLWQGEVETGSQVGLWLESYGGAAAVSFQELKLYTPNPN
jgi:hypothetical protein